MCRLPITLANSLDPDQARRIVGADQGPNCLTLRWYFLKIFFQKVNFEKNQQTTKKHEKLPSMQLVNDKTDSNLFTAPFKSLF